MLDEDYFNLRDRLIEDGYIVTNPKRFSRPDIQDVLWYFHEKGIGDDMARQFYSYWDGLDWMVKNTRIKSWKGRAANWIKKNEEYKRNDSSGVNGYDHESTNWG